MMRHAQEIWGVTLEFSIRFRHAIPLDEALRVIGRVTEEGRRHFEGTGEILLKDGTVAAEGRGKYLKLPLEKIADFNIDEQEWRVVPSDEDPEVVEF